MPENGTYPRKNFIETSPLFDHVFDSVFDRRQIMTTMNLISGAAVYCTDQECGKVAHIAIDPKTEHVTEIIVAHGIPFFKQYWVVPFSSIRAELDQSIHLTTHSKEWGEFPQYQEVAVDEVDNSAVGAMRSPHIDGTISYETPVVRHYERRGITAGRLLVHNGTPVEHQGGVVGKVDHLLLEAKSGKLAYVVMRRGLLQQKHVIVPAHYFTYTQSDSLTLVEEVSILDNLTHYENQGEDTLLVEVEQYLSNESTAFRDVHAVMEQGVLHLTGTVISNELRRHAGELAHTVPGINSVQNDLHVIDSNNPPKSVAEEWDLIRHSNIPYSNIPHSNIQQSNEVRENEPMMNNIETLDTTDEVANEVSYALASDNRTNAASIVVDHQDGLIYLRGQVESLAIQQMAETLAASQPGVKAVINGLTIDEAPKVVMH